MSMQTYSKKKLRIVQESGSETANDVFPNSPIPKSPFSFTESSESEKENKKASKRKDTSASTRKKPSKRLKSSENLKTNHQRFNSIGRKYPIKSRSDEAFTKQSPLTKKHEGYQCKTQKNIDMNRNRNKQTQNKDVVKKNTSLSGLGFQNNSPPSIELPRKDVQVTWQEKISMLYPLMVDSNAKASQYDYKMQKALPTLNVSHSSIDEVEEDETEDDSDDEDEDDDGDDDNGESSAYRTTYTYTWVTDNDTQQTPAVQVEDILPVPCEIEDVKLDDIMFENDEKQHGRSRSEIQMSPSQNLSINKADLPTDTVNFLRKIQSKILNSTVKNDAAQNIQQNCFPTDISSICPENVDTFKVPQLLTNKESIADLQIQNVSSEIKQEKPQTRKRQINNNTSLMSDGNRSKDKQKTKSKDSSVKIGRSSEVLVKSRKSKTDNLQLKDSSLVNDQIKEKSSILNSTVKNSAAKNIKQVIFPNDISSISQCDLENSKAHPSTKSKMSNIGNSLKIVKSKTSLQNPNSNKSQKEPLLQPEALKPVSITKRSKITNIVSAKDKKTKRILNSTEIPDDKVKSNRKVEWPYELSTIIPDGSLISAQQERTPKKVTQCYASTPKKLKQKDKTENKYRKLQPKSSTMLFVSNQEGIDNVIPDMSTIWRDTLTNDNKATESDHDSDIFDETVLAQQTQSNTNAEQKKDEKDRSFKKIVTSTPSKSSSRNSHVKRFELDISTVQEPSFDEEMLFLRNSTEVNSLEIAPSGSDEDNKLVYNKKGDLTAINLCVDYNQELPKQSNSEKISDTGQKRELVKGKTKKRQSSVSKQLSKRFTEDHLTKVKKHLPSSDKNTLDSLTASDCSKVIKEITAIDKGSDVKETSEQFTDGQRIEALLDGSINFKGSIKERKLKRNIKRLNSSVPLCPLTELAIVSWPKTKMDINLKILKRKPSVTSLQKIPEDVLFLLDKRFQKKQCLSC